MKLCTKIKKIPGYYQLNIKKRSHDIIKLAKTQNIIQ